MVRFLATLILFWCGAIKVSGQCRTITVNEQTATATGKVCKRSVKSTYGKMETELRTGEWTFINEDGVLFKRGSYADAGDISLKTGDWQWLDEHGKCFLKLKYEEDRPIKILAIDSGIAVDGDDSAWVFMPDSAHYRVRFSLKGVHKQWDLERLGEWLEYAPKNPVKKTYKPVVGVIGKNEQDADATGTEKEIKANIIWTDEEMLEMFPQAKKLAVPGMSGVDEEQNLIRNPHFKARGKPMKNGKYVLTAGMIDYWNASEESPDIFVDAPEIHIGFRAAGENYEGIRSTLKMPLEEGKYYCFSVRIKLKKGNIYALNDIGVLVTGMANYHSENGAVTEVEDGTFLLPPSNTPVCLRDSWMTVEGRFKAKGGEKYLYFGHFSDAQTMQHWALDSIFNFSGNSGEIYYWMKDPVLIAADKADMCICNLQHCPEEEKDTQAAEQPEPEIDVDTFVLSTVQFHSARWALLESSFEALDSLADYLLDHESYTIEITGHTDGQGNPKDNLSLSEKRAKAVFLYLRDKGVKTGRMRYSGKGDTEPVDDNDYEEGRERNRRVEFRITKTE